MAITPNPEDIGRRVIFTPATKAKIDSTDVMYGTLARLWDGIAYVKYDWQPQNAPPIPESPSLLAWEEAPEEQPGDAPRSSQPVVDLETRFADDDDAATALGVNAIGLTDTDTPADTFEAGGSDNGFGGGGSDASWSDSSSDSSGGDTGGSND